MEMEILAENLALAEGPVVMPDGSVIVTEAHAGRLVRVWGAGRREVACEIGGGPNGAQLGPDGAIYVCNNGGVRADGSHGGEGRIERVDLSAGKVERLYDSADGLRLQAPNDLVVDADGGIWFTDFGCITDRVFGKSGVYWCRPDGREIRVGYHGGIGYNGIGLSPDGRMLYVATSFSGYVYGFHVAGPGRLSGEPGLRGVPEQFIGRAAGDAGFDSLAVTASGAVCAATLWTGGITTVRPNGDTSFVALPDAMVTNIAFGGEDMCDAYITFGETGRLVKTRWDEPGLELNFGWRGGARP